MKKTLIITGASAGIGFAIAQEFLEKGFEVINLSRNPCSLQGVKNYKVDLSEMSDLTKFSSDLKKLFSSKQKITLIHNAFFYSSDSLESFSLEETKKSFEVAVLAPMFLNKEILPFVTEGSSVIFIGSTLSEKAVSGAMTYSTLKHATLGLMRAVAQDLGKFNKIHTCAICPGFTRTKMLEEHLKKQNSYDLIKEKVLFKRLVEPKEIAELSFFCAENPSINGSVLHANLGQVES